LALRRLIYLRMLHLAQSLLQRLWPRVIFQPGKPQPLIPWRRSAANRRTFDIGLLKRFGVA
jgi:hypothetical protein